MVLGGTVVFTLSGGPIGLTFAGSDRGGDAPGSSAPDRGASQHELEVTTDDGRLVHVELDADLGGVSRSHAERP